MARSRGTGSFPYFQNSIFPQFHNFTFPITSTNTARTFEAVDFERGFVMSRVGTDEAFDFSAPAGATVCSDWRAFGGNFPKNTAREISYTLHHPNCLNESQITITQPLRFCPEVTPEDETNIVGVAAFDNPDSPDERDDGDTTPQPLDDDDPNLESDPEHSYDPKVKRPLLAP